MAPEPPSPSASAVLLPFLGARSRRSSLASITSRRGEIDKDALSQALDTIHTSASRSEALTCFHDFDGGGPKPSAPKDGSRSGVSGLYNRFKQSVGGSPQKDGREQTRNSVSTPAGTSTDSLRPDSSSRQSTTLASSRAPQDSTSAASANKLPTPVTPNSTDPSPTFRNPEQRLRSKTQGSGDSQKGTGAQQTSQIDAKPDNLRIEVPDEAPRSISSSKDRDTTANETTPRISVPRPPTPPAGRPPGSFQSSNFSEDMESAIIDSEDEDAGLEAQQVERVSLKDTKAADLSSKVETDRSIRNPMAVRPPLPHVGISHLPGFEPSRASSTTDGGEKAPSNGSLGVTWQPMLQPSPNLNAALQRKRTPAKPPGPLPPLVSVPTNLRRRVISKEFWMKDENAKDCFSCGQAFSTFRRKHHCRTCGQIFDAKCMSIVPGRPFGQPGTLRLCKPCEAMIFDDDDDSTVFTDDGDDLHMRSPMARRSYGEREMPETLDGASISRYATEVATPTIGIPASRRNRESKRRSAVIEFDAPPTLARPTSSHSLISLGRRPRSSSHRRHQSRQQHIRGSLLGGDEWTPFQQNTAAFPLSKGSQLPAFHHDNVIDPDLAPFMSDEGSDEDEHPSILSAFDHDDISADRERLGLSGLVSSAIKKGRSRLGDRQANGSSGRGARDVEPSTPGGRPLPNKLRTRNASIGSMNVGRPSPKRSRSNLLLGPPDPNGLSPNHSPPIPDTNLFGTKVLRSSAMHGNEAPHVQLNSVSLEHVRKLLSQMLMDAGVQSISSWSKALMPILLQCTDGVEPDVQQGDDMDIRHYIKMKKVPGGRPGDTSYVSGVVFSKNVALKSMATSIRNPRIIIITFAIEYARHETHFLSLEPVIAQEREYLRNLIARIVALKPKVLLVQRHVSGLALQLLEAAGITVVTNIKASVLAAVSRVVQTPMLKSVDKLAIDSSEVGQCESFDVKTYIHRDVRKTYIFLSGCLPELGCTIVLRGGTGPLLRTIKRIAEFMCYVCYNLKLENYLMRDQFIAVPSEGVSQLAAHDGLHASHRHSGSQLSPEGRNVAIRDGSTSDTPSKYEELEQECRTRILSASPFVVFMQPYLLTQLRDQERRLATYKMLRDQYAAADEDDEGKEDDEIGVEADDHFELVRPEMVQVPASKDQPKAVREYLHAVHEAQFEKTLHSYDTQKRLWESFMAAGNSPFDPSAHQTIVFLHSIVSSLTSTPCFGPEIVPIEFYAAWDHAKENYEEDCTIGQYLEDICSAASGKCQHCGTSMYDHHRQYVHGYGQLSISTQRQPAKKSRGYSERILMWSSCRICREETAVIPMSDNAWKYSFAKFLELSFWCTPLHPRANLCGHDMHKDFLRCFEVGQTVVKVQYDPIEIYDIVVPRATVTWKVEADLRVKNEQYTQFASRLNAFIESIRKRLDSITLDTLEEKKQMEANAALSQLRQRADKDHKELLAKLQRKYATSRYYELLPLNRALRFMDEKAIEWDEAFMEFESDYFPSENDIRKLAVLQLKNMFLESQPPSIASVEDLSDAEDSTEKLSEPPVAETKADDLRGEKVQDVLSSTVEEHRATQQEGESTVEHPGDSEDLGASLQRKIHPREEQQQAVDREDVKHLDLALSSVPGEESPTKYRPEPSSNPGSRPVTRGGDEAEEPFATQPKPLSHGLLERIEQIRSKRAPETESVESKIPRPVRPRELQIRPPPLLRAKSQPSNVPQLNGEADTEQTADTENVEASPETPRPVDKRLSERLGMARLANKMGKVAPSLIPRSIPQKMSDETQQSGVSALAKHFEQLSREFENQRLRERRHKSLRSRQIRGGTLASSRPVVEVYRNAAEAVGEHSTERRRNEGDGDDARESLSDVPPTAANSDEPNDKPREQVDPPVATKDWEATSQERQVPSMESSKNEASQDAAPSQEISESTSELSSTLGSPTALTDMELHPELSIPEHKKNVWFNYLADFWSKRSASGWTSLAYPLNNTEHVFEDADIIVREDEPSSVIALSLSCVDYSNKVKTFRSNSQRTGPGPRHGHGHSNSQASNSTGLEQDELQKAVEASLLSDTGTHLKYSFTHNQVRASCKIFYAEAFDALRRKCGVADRFVESLSRCLKYDSKGGKTKSLFLKTLDGRFIIKSLQEVELKAFTKFAPDYFAFMSYTLFHGVPSVIAKMFGLFQVTIKNPATGLDFSYYLIVMENLFYERTPNRRFDLKGSMRNRKIESTGQPDEVLLDENLVETIFESPLFVREHARKLLQASVHNDTMWLCKQNVMDYSLMAGFDDERKELVVGIIDCIRTYTWDKKLESWIKDRGKNKPTITSPRDYRNRFRVSMMQYVLQAPNCWHQFQAQMVPPKTLKEGQETGGGGSVGGAGGASTAEQDGDTDFERERRSEAT